MSEPVYSLETVRAQVLAGLRKHGSGTAPQIAESLSIPVWAVQPALESAELGGLVVRVGEAWALPPRAAA